MTIKMTILLRPTTILLLLRPTTMLPPIMMIQLLHVLRLTQRRQVRALL